MPPPTEPHHNTNFTDFEASALRARQSSHGGCLNPRDLSPQHLMQPRGVQETLYNPIQPRPYPRATALRLRRTARTNRRPRPEARVYIMKPLRYPIMAAWRVISLAIVARPGTLAKSQPPAAQGSARAVL